MPAAEPRRQRCCHRSTITAPAARLLGLLALLGAVVAAAPTLRAQPAPVPASSSQQPESPPPGVSLQRALQLPGWASVNLTFAAEPLANTGGLARSGGWSQQLTLSAALSSGLDKDPSRWKEADHWQLTSQWTQANGRAGYGLDIGAAFPLQATDQPGGLWLTEASLERRSGLGPLAIKGGLLPLNPDFVTLPVFGAYVHSVLNDTLNLSLLGLPLSPLLAPGATASLELGRGGSLRFGTYWLAAQTRLAGLFGADPLQPPIQGSAQLLQWTVSDLPGARRLQDPIQLGPRLIQRQLPAPRLQLGAITSNTEQQGFNRVVYGAVTLPLTLPFGLDHRLWAGVNSGLDPARNDTPLVLSGGWVAQGIVPGRPFDVIALGLGRSSFSPTASPAQSDEGVVELNYNAVLNGSLSLGPVLQLILHPGGTGAVPSIVAAGMQVQLAF